MNIVLGRKNVRAGRAGLGGTLTGALMFAISVAASTQSHAETEHVRLDITASIAPRCGLVDLTNVQLPRADVTVAASMDVPFKVDCNQPFVIRITSGNGGLRLIGEGNSFGFVTFKPYDVKLDLGLSNEPNISRTCASAALNTATAASAGEGMGMGCDFFGTAVRSGLSSGNAIAAGDAAPSNLKISWRGGSQGRMLAGSYQDTLTIVVEPRS